jgi:transposase
MKSAPSALPEEPPNGLTCGIDWARDDHAVAVVDARGRQVHRCVIEHSAAGLRALGSMPGKRGVGEVVIERPDGPVVDALLEAGITVVVISPNQVKNLRGSYGSAGHKDDRFDALVLADTLRTDRARLRPLIPDQPATLALRRACRARKDLIAHRAGLASQLREHLKRIFPDAIGLFAELDSPVSLAFLARFDSRDRADWLSPRRMAAWLASIGYCGRTDPAVLHARLTAAPRGATAEHGTAEAHITRALLAVLTTLNEQIKALTTQISEQLTLHADQHILTSLPRSGRVRAARLLADTGDCRARFPAPESLACLAGVAPSTRQSGKIRAAGFRWSCDKQLRDALTDFAGDSRHASPRAARLYDDAIARGHDHPHAVRILACAWTHIIWQCWQDGAAYDPGRHKALQRILAERKPAAA